MSLFIIAALNAEGSMGLNQEYDDSLSDPNTAEFMELASNVSGSVSSLRYKKSRT